MSLMVGKATCELVKISDASPLQKVDKFAGSLHGSICIPQLVSLWPRDAAVVRQYSDEGVVTVDESHQMPSAVVQPPHPSLVERQHFPGVI